MISATGRLQGKTAIVTGSTRGFGSAIVRRFAQEGANVVITGRSEADGKAVEADIAAGGGAAIFVAADIRDEDAVEALVARTVAEFGGVDVLVNNAMAMDHIGDSESPVADLDTAGFERMIRVGIYGVVFACKYALREMVKSGRGSIINVSSIAAVGGVPHMPGYTASKGAMQALTRQMATDYGPQGIRINTLVSGFVFSSELAAAVDAHPVAGPLMREGQLTRWGTLEDVSGFATFLASDESEFINGAELRMDGGWSATARIPNLAEMVFAPMAAAAAAAQNAG
jgi:NAD(P)-dependent dehydrogenase (short-subunit alcohol dehydrogenase family)